MIHIAICDDEKDFVAHLNGLLDQYAAETGEDIKVTAYYDGMELIEKYDTAIDLIFLDIQMRLVNGLLKDEDVCRVQSIGMTNRQLRRLLMLEGLYYAGVTLLFSYSLGALTVGVIVRKLVYGGFSTFHFTLLPLVVCNTNINYLCSRYPLYLFQKFGEAKYRREIAGNRLKKKTHCNKNITKFPKPP